MFKIYTYLGVGVMFIVGIFYYMIYVPNHLKIFKVNKQLKIEIDKELRKRSINIKEKLNEVTDTSCESNCTVGV